MFIKLKKFTDVKKIGYKNDDFKKLYNINDDKKNIDNYIFVNTDNIIYIDNHFIYCTEFTLYCSDSGVKKIMKKISVKWLLKWIEILWLQKSIGNNLDNADFYYLLIKYYIFWVVKFVSISLIIMK